MTRQNDINYSTSHIHLLTFTLAGRRKCKQALRNITNLSVRSLSSWEREQHIWRFRMEKWLQYSGVCLYLWIFFKLLNILWVKPKIYSKSLRHDVTRFATKIQSMRPRYVFFRFLWNVGGFDRTSSLCKDEYEQNFFFQNAGSECHRGCQYFNIEFLTSARSVGKSEDLKALLEQCSKCELFSPVGNDSTNRRKEKN